VTRGRALLLWTVGLALAAALPVAGRTLRGRDEGRCALDGVAVDELHGVRVEGHDGTSRTLCCIGCAAAWLRDEPSPPRRIVVRDESTGAEVDARSAWYVESRVVAVRATGCYIHAFATREAAERHAEEFRGELLTGDAAPFAPPKER
jgi:hypothetical protein